MHTLKVTLRYDEEADTVCVWYYDHGGAMRRFSLRHGYMPALPSFYNKTMPCDSAEVHEFLPRFQTHYSDYKLQFIERISKKNNLQN